ncbi:tyrosine-type recombinase/integrase [Kribbella sp. DT2]|uniref:tyrosine-type recombinase/integrase n=1 Tax=Kribbella sp. DT2 TaxID=3393427 RepID=UPI003CF4EC2D
MLDLIDSWVVHLQAEHKASRTIRVYATGVRQYFTYCAEKGLPEVLDRRQVQAWIAGMMESGLEPTTADVRLTAVKRFSWWLHDEDEIDTDVLAGIKAPKIGEKIVRPLSMDEIQALLGACKGKDFLARRDEAIIRLMLDTGLRASELCGLKLTDVKVVAGTAVALGKGNRERTVAFGAQTARALDRWLRVRRTHGKANTSSAFFLGGMGRTFGYPGLARCLALRGEQAGLGPVNPHKLRHTWATRWRNAGGSEQSMMALAGWTSPKMIARYTRATSAERAVAESQQLNLGDL